MYINTKESGSVYAGTAVKDAEYREIGEANTPMVEFTLAVNAFKTEGIFMDCKVIGKLLTPYAVNIKKGDAVMVVGFKETYKAKNDKEYTRINVQWLNYISLPKPKADDYIETSDAELPF